MPIKEEKLEDYQDQTYRGMPTIPYSDEESVATQELLEKMGATITDVRTGLHVHRGPLIPLTAENLRNSGLLWLINTSVFHPRGYALFLSIPTEEEKAEGHVESFGFWGDGTEPYSFGDSTEEEFTALERVLSSVTTFVRPIEREESDVSND